MRNQGTNDTVIDEDTSLSGKRLLAFDIGTATAGTAIDYGIGWGIASGVFGATMTTGLAVTLGVTALGCIAVGTMAMMLVQGGNSR